MWSSEYVNNKPGKYGSLCKLVLPYGTTTPSATTTLLLLLLPASTSYGVATTVLLYYGVLLARSS